MAEIMDSKTKVLTLKSSDGKEFSLSESAAVLSGVLKGMVADGLTEGEIPIGTVDGSILEKVIGYLNKHAEGGVSDGEKKKFDEEFVTVEEMKVLFEIAKAANFLEIKGLMATACQEIAKRMKDKSVKWVREMFNVENDFDAEEEEMIKAEYPWAWEGVESDGDNN
ncbi:SCF ubiquitin ligase, Skp1 component [Handroanthus impetiginosus]|uniref:SKP1-like protein n=1 Tax=Handroanthus impetiginosus TaxID=429701 RepID=A0A2G9GRJ3_9LAMI|nr:SCF ubiquitin ligase, Skp1 component [Handroanthus impetiginosus]